MGIPTIVNSFRNNSATNPSTSITFGPWNLATGDMVVFAIRNGSSLGVSTVVDTAGNTWLSKTKYTNGTIELQFYYCVSAIGNATNIVTVTFLGSVNSPSGWLWDVSGQASGDSSDVDAGILGAGSTSPVTSPQFSTSFPNELLLAVGTFNSTVAVGNVAFTPSAGWTSDGNILGQNNAIALGLAQHISSAAQLTNTTVSMSYVISTGSPPTAQGIAVFSIKGVASSTNGSLTLLGCGI